MLTGPKSHEIEYWSVSLGEKSTTANMVVGLGDEIGFRRCNSLLQLTLLSPNVQNVLGYSEILYMPIQMKSRSYLMGFTPKKV